VKRTDNALRQFYEGSFRHETNIFSFGRQCIAHGQLVPSRQRIGSGGPGSEDRNSSTRRSLGPLSPNFIQSLGEPTENDSIPLPRRGSRNGIWPANGSAAREKRWPWDRQGALPANAAEHRGAAALIAAA